MGFLIYVHEKENKATECFFKVPTVGVKEFQLLLLQLGT